MRIRTLLKYLFFSITILFVMERVINFIEKDYFRIVNVTIKGDYSFLQNDIVEELLNLKGKNIWKIDENKISKYIKKDVRVKSFYMKKLIPDKVEIEISERKPYVYILWNQKLYTADEEQNIFAYRLEKPIKNLLIVKINKIEEFKKMYEALKKIDDDMKIDISNIYIENEIIKIQLIDGTIFKSDEEVNKEKYENGYKLYLKVKKEQEIEYIDLRFEDYILK